MGKVKFELNMPGLNELMKGEEMQGVLESAAQAAVNAAGDGYDSRVHVASFVAIANVYPVTKKAQKDNYENNTLLRAVGSVNI